MTAHAPTQQSSLAAAAAATAAVLTLAADAIAPNTAAIHMLYAVPILLTWFVPLRWSTETAGGAAVAFTLVGLLAAPGRMSGIAITDHAMAVGLFIVMTVLLVRTKTSRAREVANEARFRALTQATSDVVYRMSPDWSEMRHLVGREFIVDTNEPSRSWLDTYIHPDDQPQVRVAMEQAVRTKSMFSLLHRVRQLDGTLGWMASRAVPIFDARGEILEWFGTASDVTARKQAEEALRASEERFRALAQASSDVVYRMSADWTEMRHLVGRDFIADTLEPSQTWLQKYIHPDDQPYVMATINEAIHTKSVFELEHRIRRVDGSLGWTFSRAIPILDANGDITEWFGMASDVTARKQAAEALRHSREMLRDAEHIGKIGAWELEIETERQTWTEGVYEIHEVDSSFEPTAENGINFYPLEARETIAAAVRRATEQGEPFDLELPFVTAKGNRRWVHAIGRRDPMRVRVHGFLQDITERKQAEEVLERVNAGLEHRVELRTRELVDRTRQLQRLASDLTLAEQKTREELAHVLHDGIQQLLFGARLRVDRMRRTLRSGVVEGSDLERLGATLDECIAATRALSVELAPPVLREKGLAAGLAWLANWMHQTHGLVVDTKLHEAGNPEAWDVQALIFESVRELLFNVVKHGGVSEASMEFGPEPDDRFRVTIRHDGTGFDAATVGQHAVAGGLGLVTIRERLALLGGHLEIESQPNTRSVRFTLIGKRTSGTTKDADSSRNPGRSWESRPAAAQRSPLPRD